MLQLDSPKWSDLRHAYGSAADIPAMLHELEQFPPNEGSEAPPYFMLWSSLCHQDDVYTASYAVVPHIIRILASAPSRAHWDFFLLPACIEIARAKGRGPEIPAELRDDYFAALRRIPALAAAAAESQWDEGFCRTVTAAIAVAKGQPALGEAILELDSDTVKKFMEARFDE
jgi:hypothetical protein